MTGQSGRALERLRLVTQTVAALGLIGTSCSSKGAAANSDDLDAATTCPAKTAASATEVRLAGACAADARLGGFEVNDAGPYSSVSGSVLEGVVPSQLQEELLSVGDCRLLRRPRLFCDPPCAGEETCDFAGDCIPYPAALDVGRVAVRGLASCLALEARAPGNNYFATDVAHPAAGVDAVVELEFDSPLLGRALLHGVGVVSLAPGEPSWTVTRGANLPVHWKAAPPGARSRIFMSLNIDQHGSTPATITCDTEDDGELEVPATLIDGLLMNGVSGFPNGVLIRRTVDRTDTDVGCVDFSISSGRRADVHVE